MIPSPSPPNQTAAPGLFDNPPSGGLGAAAPASAVVIRLIGRPQVQTRHKSRIIPGRFRGGRGPKCPHCGGALGVATYDPKAQAKKDVAREIQAQWRRPPLTGPVVLGWVFGMPIPKGSPKARLADMARGVIKHVKRPDVDNLIKFYKDAMTKIVYKDDSQVWAYCDTPRKIYVPAPGFTEITILQ